MTAISNMNSHDLCLESFEHNQDDAALFDRLYQLFAPGIDCYENTTEKLDMISITPSPVMFEYPSDNIGIIRIEDSLGFPKNSSFLTEQQLDMMKVSTLPASSHFTIASTFKPIDIEQDRLTQVTPHHDFDTVTTQECFESSFWKLENQKLNSSRITMYFSEVMKSNDEKITPAISSEFHGQSILPRYVISDLKDLTSSGTLLPDNREYQDAISISTASTTEYASDESSFLSNIADPKCNDALANLGLEAYLKSVELAAKNDPKKMKAMKSDGTLGPLRPLSAYNYFFRDERERILKEGDGRCHSPDPGTFYSNDRLERTLKEHWNQDRTKRRRHRKTHGQISFTSLSKLVSRRWQELPEEYKNFYKEISTKDWDRYHRELFDFNISK